MYGKILSLAFLLLLAFPALAEEPKATPVPDISKDAPYVYQPDMCEFSIKFPEEPYTTQRCDPSNPEKCYEQLSYTKVFDMQSTVNFRVICSPVDAAMQKNYTKEVMEATLRAMTRRSTVDSFDTTYREEGPYKQAGLVGQGKSGLLPTIYIAQIWMGEHSALSVEAELIGDAHEKADKLFADTLKSVHFVKK